MNSRALAPEGKSPFEDRLIFYSLLKPNLIGRPHSIFCRVILRKAEILTFPAFGKLFLLATSAQNFEEILTSGVSRARPRGIHWSARLNPQSVVFLEQSKVRIMEPHSSASFDASSVASARPSRTGRNALIWFLVLLVFGLLFYWIWQQTRSRQDAVSGSHRSLGPVPATLATARLGDIGSYIDAIGTVTPANTGSITAQVTGVITQVHYREGQSVRKGELLLDLDARAYEAQLAQARGTMQRDESTLAEAKMDLERYKQAWSRNAISRQTLEDQEKLVLQDEGTLKNDEGAVQYDQLLVSYCHITSPIDGRVGLRLVDPGNLVTANSTTPLVVVTQINPITVIFTAPQDRLQQVMEQLRAHRQLSVEAYDDFDRAKLAVGKLITVDNQIDTTTGTVKLRAEFDNRNGVLFPNQFVNVRLLVSTLHNQVLVPSSAVQHNGGADFVYVIQDGKAHMRSVQAGAADKGETAVTGLQAGDVVANSSFEKLMEGSQVLPSRSQLPGTEAHPEKSSR